jgi:hypothetical protein
MGKYFGLATAGAQMGLLLGSACSGNIAQAQPEGQATPVPTPNSSSNSADRTAPAVPATTSPSSTQPSSDNVESSLFSSLFMAGRTQDQFQPLNLKERLKVYAKDLLSPFHFMMAGVSAGITQAQNVPPEWGQGIAGYGRRFANYYAYALTSDMLQMAGEDILHDDNLYYGSGEHGIWRRVKYAGKSSVPARSNDGTQHFSVSQVGSTAGRRSYPACGSRDPAIHPAMAPRVLEFHWQPMPV